MLTLSTVSIVLAVASAVLSLVAIKVTLDVGRDATKALKNATKIATLSSGQLLRYLTDRSRPPLDQIAELGADIWTCSASSRQPPPGENVRLGVTVTATGWPLFDRDPPSLRCSVDAPSGLISRVNVAAKAYEDGPVCSWDVLYPYDFELAKSDEEGIYRIQWEIPDKNYGDRLNDAIFVLAA